jgi:diaminohydroxyphosphoribosylaminopyrimidine deaminase/5-amino-6-(5-phosphoribosylamino)uracil reductase
MRDPDPQAQGGGERLRAAGVAFEHGLLEAEARELNIGFVSRITRRRPWVRLKMAATLDGRTALEDGRSQWITGPEARRDGHAWRARACAVLTGIGTVKTDNPQLTVREVATPRQPLRVIVDSRLETPPDARILQGERVLVFAAREGTLPNAEVVVLPNARGKVELPQMLAALAARGINELHVEAGFRLNGSLVREGCVDEFLVYLNPSFLGDTAQGMLDLPAPAALDARLRLEVISTVQLGGDLRLLARPAAAAERGTKDLDRNTRAAPRRIEARAVLDELHRGEVVAAADTFERACQFVCGHPARHRRADARRFLRRDDIEVDGNAERGGAAGRDAERLLEDAVQTAFMHFLDVKNAYAEALETLALFRLEAAHADQADVLRLDHAGGEAVERVVVLTEEPRERHAVQASGMAGARRVRVHVRVDPDQAERSLYAARHAGPCTARAAVVAAEDTRQALVRDRVGDGGGEQAA